MDLVTENQEQRLAALERVVSAPAVESPGLARELAATALLFLCLVGSVGAALAVVLGALWLFS
ncbi:MAG TPA: hypothetical protein VM324_15565 [Egibacteraceae bacterium]|jgi:fatty acid desaturase|nr:hypothetical protein [Egibacteraceae bacterium]